MLHERARSRLRALGTAGRPALALVHGWPDDVRCWDKVIERLSDQNFRVYTPYLRGSGPTRFLRDDTMRSGAIAALTLDLSQFLDALDLKRVAMGPSGLLRRYTPRNDQKT